MEFPTKSSNNSFYINVLLSLYFNCAANKMIIGFGPELNWRNYRRDHEELSETLSFKGDPYKVP